jgi:hypothetical protein
MSRPPSQRLLLINIGSNNGLLSRAEILCYESAGTGDDRGQMNSMNFETWMNVEVLPFTSSIHNSYGQCLMLLQTGLLSVCDIKLKMTA